MNKGTAKRIAVMIRRRLFSLLKYPKFPLDTFEDVFALLCFLFLFFFSVITHAIAWLDRRQFFQPSH